MTDAPLLSIVIPVYNEEGILHASIVDLVDRLSGLTELVPSYEILLSENGSSDGTLEVEMTQAFVDRVRQRFSLPEGASPTNDQVRAFVCEGIAKALDRAGG